MAKMSLLDKLSVLLEVSKTSKIFIFVLIFLIFLAYISFTTNKKNAKTGKRIYIGIYAFILLLTLIVYNQSLSRMFDYMMNNLFIIVYFPNLAIYLAAIIITNIILAVSVFNFKTSKLIRNINIVVYCIMNYLLALILGIINDKKLDVFTQKSIYGNKNVQALIELSSTIFVLWIIFLIVYKIILKYQNKGKEVETKPKKIIIRRRRTLPNNITEIKVPKYVKAEDKKINVSNKNIKHENVPRVEPSNTMINRKFEDQAAKEFDKLLTLDDYKLLVKMLKETKEKERLEAERKKRQEDEQSKFRELQELYKSVR